MENDRCLIHNTVMHFDRKTGQEECYQCNREGESEPPTPLAPTEEDNG